MLYNTKLKNNENKDNILLTISDDIIEQFLLNLTEAKIKGLYKELKIYHINGLVNYKNYNICMKKIFDPNKQNYFQILKKKTSFKSDDSYSSDDENSKDENSSFNDLYYLLFQRFREIGCVVKNNKNIFYLTDFNKKNFISSYNLVCVLTMFLKIPFDNKIKLLFELTDNDDDGYINKKEIEKMLTKVNQLFGEENKNIITNSSIASQSLASIKINNILSELFYGDGDLYKKLEEEKYINFDTLFKSIQKIRNYKYKILPCYISLKHCLSSQKSEKIINVKQNNKKDFVNISTEIILEQNKTINKDNYKKFSLNNLAQVLKPYLSDIKKPVLLKRKAYKLSKVNALQIKNYRSKNNIKCNKNISDLIKTSTIFNEENNKVNYSSSIYGIYKSKTPKSYAFNANLEDIKYIEVEPGIVKFIDSNKKENRNETSESKLKIINETSTTKNSKIIKTGHKKFQDSLQKHIKKGIAKWKNRNIFNSSKNDKKNETRKFTGLFPNQTLTMKKGIRLTKGKLTLKHSKSDFYVKSFMKNIGGRVGYKTLEELMTEIKEAKERNNQYSFRKFAQGMISNMKSIQFEMNNLKKNFYILKEKRNSFQVDDDENELYKKLKEDNKLLPFTTIKI